MRTFSFCLSYSLLLFFFFSWYILFLVKPLPVKLKNNKRFFFHMILNIYIYIYIVHGYCFVWRSSFCILMHCRILTQCFSTDLISASSRKAVGTEDDGANWILCNQGGGSCLRKPRLPCVRKVKMKGGKKRRKQKCRQTLFVSAWRCGHCVRL